jgi:hypothetical protein
MTVYYIDNGVADNTGTGLKYTGLTADAGTDATKIVDAGLNGMVIPNGSFVYNTTRSLGAVTTGWVDATDTLTVAIAGQSAGDSYYLITPWKTVANYTTTTARTAGDIAYVRAGTTETVAAIIVCDEDGTPIAPLSIIGTGDGTTNLEATLGITAWQDGATARPILDFNSGAYCLSLNGDNYWDLTNLDFINTNTATAGSLAIATSIGSRITNCIFRDSQNASGAGVWLSTTAGDTIFTNCQFTNNDGSNVKCDISGRKITFIGCSFNGGAETTTYGLHMVSEGTVYLNNCTFGTTSAHGTADIYVPGRGTYIIARNCVFTSSPFYVIDTGMWDSVIYTEDEDGVFGANAVYKSFGSVTKSTSYNRAGGADSVAKILASTNITRFPVSISGKDYTPDFRLWHTTSPSTISVYVRCYSSWATYPTTAETYLQAEFVSSTTDPPTRTTVTSTDVIASTETWTPFTVAVAPERPGFVNLKLFHSAASSSGGILVDIKPVIS